MRCKSQRIAARREGNGVHPPARRVHVLAADGVERDALSPRRGLGPLVDALDECGEDAGVGVGGAGREEDAVGVPGEREHRRAQWLLEVLGHPPVVLLLKVADGDGARARADGEFGLVG